MNQTQARMTCEPVLDDEEGRLRAIERYQIVDTAPEPAFDRITALLRSVLDMPIAFVSLVESERQWFKSTNHSGLLETPRSVAFCSHTISGSGVLAVPNALEDPHFASNPLVTGEPFLRAYIGAPLRTPDGYNVGSLCAVDLSPRTFTERDRLLVEEFARLTVDQLELRQAVSTDEMTGTLARRAFLNAVDAGVASALRRRARLALAVFDLDHFKQINDAHGHVVGDDVLRAVSFAVRKKSRAGSVIGRLGGEEFAILMPDTGARGAMTAAERCRAAIEDAVLTNQPDVRFTASFGVATLNDSHNTTRALVDAADGALYAAKNEGRNRVCLCAGCE